MRQVIVLSLLITIVTSAPAGHHPLGISIIKGSSVPHLRTTAGLVNSDLLATASVVSVKHIAGPQWLNWSPGVVGVPSYAVLGKSTPASTISVKNDGEQQWPNWTPGVVGLPSSSVLGISRTPASTFSVKHNGEQQWLNWSPSVVRLSPPSAVSTESAKESIIGGAVPASTISLKSVSQPQWVNWSPAVVSSVDSTSGWSSRVNHGTSLSSAISSETGNVTNEHVVSPVSTWSVPDVSSIGLPAISAVPITKTIYYETKPVVTGYSTHIIRSGPSSLDTSPQILRKEKVLVPVRPITKITPQVTRIEPEVNIQRVAVDVPVAQPVAVPTPVVQEINYSQPVIQDEPAPAPGAKASVIQNVQVPSAVWHAPSVSVKKVDFPSTVQVQSSVWDTSAVQDSSVVLGSSSGKAQLPFYVSFAQDPTSVSRSSVSSIPQIPIETAKNVNLQDFSVKSSIGQTHTDSWELEDDRIGVFGAPPSLAVRTANTAPGWVTTTW